MFVAYLYKRGSSDWLGFFGSPFFPPPIYKIYLLYSNILYIAHYYINSTIFFLGQLVVYLFSFGLFVFWWVAVVEKEIAVKRIGTRSHSDRVTNPVIKRAASANVSYSFELRRQKDYLPPLFCCCRETWRLIIKKE